MKKIMFLLLLFGAISGCSLNRKEGKSPKIATIYKEHVMVRVDNTDRLLVSKKWFNEFHTDKNIDIIINNEKYIGKHQFKVCDTLSSYYLIGEGFLKKNGIYLIVYNNKIKCLYTKDNRDVSDYKAAMQSLEIMDIDRGVLFFEKLLKRGVLSNFTSLDALDCFSRVENETKRVDLFSLLNNHRYKDLDYHSRNKVELHILP